MPFFIYDIRVYSVSRIENSIIANLKLKKKYVEEVSSIPRGKVKTYHILMDAQDILKLATLSV